MVTRPVSRYEGIADWYDQTLLDPDNRNGLATIAQDSVATLLGQGSGVVLDIGCGTGIAHARLREAGYQPVGIDLAFDQLRIASGRLPVAQADAARLPIPDGVVPAAFSTFVASDLDDFESAAAEVYRVLEPGGRYVAVCIHPCFDGNHAERRADGNVLQLTGYRVTSFAPASHFSTPVRGAVGAWHRPLADQINLYLRLGFVLREVREDGTEPIPNQLALLLQKPDERNAA